ncbi:hypothetical protein B296_00038188 [Ensete ventricosum]|uniref:Uncharacterized protein n=1 Tax=Ensete ventricosum TaxID=4639 RepID=A0A426XZ21_ENSVE|nr:hypothetical protein B296_00038188 [Ensete ventricosum]
MAGLPVDLGGPVARTPGYGQFTRRSLAPPNRRKYPDSYAQAVQLPSLGGSTTDSCPKAWAMAIHPSKFSQKWFPPFFEFRLELDFDQPSG